MRSVSPRIERVRCHSLYLLKSRACAHIRHPRSPIPHTVLFFSIRVSCRISRGTLPRAAGPSAPRRSPHGAAGGCRLWRRAAGPLPPPPLALQLMRPCRRRAWGAGGERARGAPTPLLSSTPPILLLRILLGCCARRLDRRGSSRGGGIGGDARAAPSRRCNRSRRRSSRSSRRRPRAPRPVKAGLLKEHVAQIYPLRSKFRWR